MGGGGELVMLLLDKLVMLLLDKLVTLLLDKLVMLLLDKLVTLLLDKLVNFHFLADCTKSTLFTYFHKFLTLPHPS